VIGLVHEREATLPIQSQLAALARRHRVPGAQLAVHEGGRTAAVETGELEFGSRRRVTRSSAFALGSITKAFTATLAMVLVADGDLDLDAPVADHLPELADLGDGLTLRHLLSHTGGLASGPDADGVRASTARRYLSDHCGRTAVLVPPGTAFSYSNLGYVIVGSLVETVTGMSWWEATESILLRPLGITPTFLGGPSPAAGPPAAGSLAASGSAGAAGSIGVRGARRPTATGHSVNNVTGRTRPVRPVMAPAEAATGGLAASAVDLVSLGLLHLGAGEPDVLGRRHAESMRRPVAGAEPFGLADGWGLGLARFHHGGVDWVGHDGNVDGTCSYLRVDPAGGRVVAFTANANTGAAMWADVVAELDRAGFPLGPAGATVPLGPPVTPEPECVGTFVNGDVEFTVARREGGRLQLAVDGESGGLTLHAGLTFSLRDPRSGRPVPGGRFLRDPATGRLYAIQVNGRLARRHSGVGRETRQRLIA
jgi:CubicO group peptidase (beta-lactamase class C family)